jgi:hypothetical protein
MTEEKKVVIDNVEYSESDLSDQSKMCINHINSLQQKIASAEFNLDQLRVGKEAFSKILADSLDRLAAEAEETEEEE